MTTGRLWLSKFAPLLGILLATTFAQATLAGGDAELSLRLPDPECPAPGPGYVVEVVLNTNGTTVAGWQSAFSWDPAKMQLDTLTGTGQFDFDIPATIDNGTGTTSVFGQQAFLPGVTGATDLVVAELSFTILPFPGLPSQVFFEEPSFITYFAGGPGFSFIDSPEPLCAVGNPTLTLDFPGAPTCPDEGPGFIVELNMSELGTFEASGIQAFVQWDPLQMTLDSVTVLAFPTVFNGPNIDNGAGTMDFGAGFLGPPGTSTDQTVALLSFTVLPGGPSPVEFQVGPLTALSFFGQSTTTALDDSNAICGEPTLVLEFPDTITCPDEGEKFIVELNLEDLGAYEASGIQAFIEWDPTRMFLQDVQVPGFPVVFNGPNIDNGLGTVDFGAGFLGPPGLTADTTIATLEFLVLAGGPSPVTFQTGPLTALSFFGANPGTGTLLDSSNAVCGEPTLVLEFPNFPDCPDEGEKFIVELNLEDLGAYESSGIQAFIQWDPALMELQDVQVPGFPVVFNGPNIDNGLGTVDFGAGFLGPPGLTIDTTIATLEFLVEPGGPSSVSFQVGPLTALSFFGPNPGTGTQLDSFNANCGEPTLNINLASDCADPNSTVVVELTMDDLGTFETSGIQAFLQWDPAQLSLDLIDITGFPVVFNGPNVDNGAGTVDFGAGVLGPPGISTDDVVATLTFTTSATDNCGTGGPAVFFDPSILSALSFFGKQPPAGTLLNDSGPLTVDGTGPEIVGCPTGPIDLGWNPLDPTCADALGLLMISDNCDPNPAVDCAAGMITGDDCNKSQSFEITATDACGNVSTCTVTYSWITDTTDPTITGCPTGPVDLGWNPVDPTCADALGLLMISDNCDANPIVDCVAGMITGDDCNKSQSFEITVTDSCGNSSSCTVTYNWITDTTDPTIMGCPTGPIDLGWNPLDPTCSDALGLLTISDNCDASPIVDCVPGMITGDDCNKSQSFAITVTDSCGNSSSCTVTYNWISDTTDPTITGCPTGPVDLGWNPLDPTCSDALGLLMISDNCDANPIVDCVPGMITGDDCNKSQSFAITVTDSCGNSSSCTVTYNWISDTTDPTITGCPTGPIDLGWNPLDPTCSDALGLLTISDNCDADPIVDCVPGMITGDDCNKSQSFEITVTDSCGNSSTCSVTYSWTTDTTDPTIMGCPTGPVDLGWNPLDPTCSDALGLLMISDNCDANPIVDCVAGMITGDDCNKSQSFEITVTDSCGNSSSCTVTYNWITDTTDPTIMGCPTGPVDLGWNPLDPTCADALGLLAISDNCDANPIVDCVPGMVTGDDCNKSQSFEITVTDSCGNSSSCSVTYSWITDTTDPTITGCPTGPIDLGWNPLDPTCSDALSLLMISDNCDADPAVDCVPGMIMGDDCNKSQTFVITVTDSCGNSSSCTVTYNWITDTTDPTIMGCPTGPVDLGWNPLDPTCADALGLLAISDNCDANPIVDCVPGMVTGDDCNKSQSFEITVTDSCGNSSSCTVTYNWITDTTDPTITGCPTGPVDLGWNPLDPTCSDALSLLMISDNCDADPAVDCVPGMIMGDDCNKSQSFEITVTDSCGNSSSCTVTYNWITDTTDPTIMGCPTGPVDLGWNPLDPTCADALGLLAISDNCDANPIVDCVPGMVTGDDCNKSQSFEITVTDSCGNSSSCTVTYSWITDTTDPTITGCPTGPIDLGWNPLDPTCSDALSLLMISDNCDADPAVDCVPGMIMGDDCNKSQSFEITVTDSCGNSSSCTVTYNWITDTTDPTIMGCPTGPVDLGWNPLDPTCSDALGLLMISDNCDANPIVDCVPGMVTGDDCNKSQSFEITVTDSCGNSSTCTVTYSWITDTTDPTITGCPTGPVDLGWNPLDPTCSDALGLLMISDNCDANPIVDCVPGMITGDDCNKSQTFEITVTDSCGNSSTCSVTYSWITDTTDPTIMGCPTGPVDLGWNPLDPTCSDALGLLTISDNCDASPIVDCVPGMITGDDCNKSQSFEITVTDSCGNSSTCTVTYSWITDTTDPTITGCPTGPVDLGWNPLDPTCSDALGLLMISDNCDASPIVDCVPGMITGDDCNKSQTFEITVTDSCGNSSTCSVTYSWITDTTDPTIMGCPTGPIDLGWNPLDPTCSDALGLLTISDNCDASPIVDCVPGMITGDDCNKSQSFEITVTDSCGNSSTCTVTYSWITDTTDPTITGCPTGPVDLGWNPLDPTCSDALGLLMISDNCDASPIVDCVPGMITGDDCNKSQTFEITVTDSCGNSSTCSVTYSWITDTTDPTIMGCPTGPIDLGWNPLDPTCSDALGLLTISDNCDASPIVDCVPGMITGDDCNKSQSFEITVTDSCGNSSTCTVTYSWITDTTDPTITGCPTGPVDLGWNPLDPTCSDALGLLMISDNCDASPIVDCVPGMITGDDCNKSQTFEITVTDSCGNSSTCSVTYSWITDTTDPTIMGCPTGPIDLGWNPLDPTCSDALGLLTISDNCDASPIVDCVPGMITGDDCNKSQSFEITVTDSCGNSSTCTVTYSWITDTTDPTITGCPTGPVDLGWNPLDPTCSDALGLLTISDNCDADPAVDCVPGMIMGDDCNKSQTFVITVTDSCGNSSTCTVTYSWITDTTDPTITGCPTGPVDLGWNPLDPTCSDALGLLTISDNCDADPAVDCVPGMVTGDDCNKSQTFVITVTDSCGNSSSCTVTYSWITDTTDPTIMGCPTGPVDLGWNPLDPTCSDALGLLTISDNCDASPIVDCVPGMITGDDCNKSQTFEITVTDSCGNSSTCSVTYSWITDTTDPTIMGCPTGPVDLGWNPLDPTCSDALGLLTISDNCDASPIVDCVPGMITGDDCNKSQSFEITVTDSCGNSSTCTVTYSWITDTTDPTIMGCPTGPVDLGWNPLDPTCSDALGLLTISDNCDASPIVDCVPGMVTGDDCNKSQSFEITVTDSCGNSSTCTVTYSWITDTTDPTITGCPTGPVDLGWNPLDPTCSDALGLLTISDNCDASPIVDCVPGMITGDDCNKSQTFEITVTDSCGNSSSCTVTYSWITDTTDPTITGCPTGPVDLGWNPLDPTCSDALGLLTISDNCDADPAVDCVPGMITGDDCNKSQTFVITVTDSCGNSSSCTVTYSWITDTTDPTIMGCPTGPVDLGWNPLDPTCSDALGLLTISDNCDASPIVDCVPGMITGDDCNKSQTFEITVTDSCGNSSSCTVTYSWITDTTDPVWDFGCVFDVVLATSAGGDCPDVASISLNVGDEIDVFTGWNVAGFNIPPLDGCVADNCTAAGDLIIRVVAKTDDNAGPCQQILTITFEAEDECGNTVRDFTCTYTVVDDVAPVPPPAPSPLAFQCAADVPPPGDLSAQDDCAGKITATGVDSDNGGSGCSSDPLIITRTWTFDDGCGNTSSVSQTITVSDTQAPVLTCPASVEVNADAGVCTATVDPGTATAVDNCDGAVAATGVRSDGQPLNAPYPGGDTTITWTATDSCGNSDSCVQTITVSSFNEIVMDITLSPNVETPLTRCITFELGTPGCAKIEVSQEITFTGGTASGVTVLVPCGLYECITARDRLHTLERTDETFSISGTQYVADFTGDDQLVGGNLNDDPYIDILDFGVHITAFDTDYGTGDTTCTTSFPHADTSGNGVVGDEDLTFIIINFLQFSEDVCCGAAVNGGGPVVDISLAELQQRGLGHLAVADLNGDGRLSDLDIVAFLDGATPDLPEVFTSDEDGLWTDPEMWANGQTPSASTNVALTVEVLVDSSGAQARNVRITGSGTLVIDGGDLLASSVTVESGGRLSIANGLLDTTSLEVLAGATIVIDDAAALLLVESLYVDEGATLEWLGGTIEVVSGTLTHAAGDLVVGSTAVPTTLRLVDSVATVSGNVFVGATPEADGLIEVLDASSLFVEQSLIVGELGRGHLVITGNSEVTSDTGHVSFDPAAVGILTIEAGSVWTTLSTMELGGTLTVMLPMSPEPVSGDVFEILLAETISGEFDEVSASDLGDEMIVEVSYGIDAVRATVRSVAIPKVRAVPQADGSVGPQALGVR